MIQFINGRQCGYGQYTLTFYCSDCEEEFTRHETGHGYEEHHDDCVVSQKHNYWANISAECPYCYNGELEEHQRCECTCEELNERDKAFKWLSLNEEEREDFLNEITDRKIELALADELERRLNALAGERPDGLTHSSAVKNWRAKRSKARFEIKAQIESENLFNKERIKEKLKNYCERKYLPYYKLAISGEVPSPFAMAY